MRILITGSRNWNDAAAMQAALAKILVEFLENPVGTRMPTLVHGDCEGADLMAAAWWTALRMPTESHPANWKELGRAAGPIRNQKMVDLGADLCLAFPMPKSRGTWDCVRRAREAGIPVEIITPKEVHK